MRHPRLADRLAFAERFTFAVLDQPFYAGLRRVAALRSATARELERVESEPPAPRLPRAA